MTSLATRRAPLGSIAYARSGDKGAHANIGVWVGDDDTFAFVRDALTADVVAGHFALADPRDVERYELANLRALNFVLRGVLGPGGGAAGLRTDAQAKAYGQALLRLECSIPLTLLAAATRPPFETRRP